MYFLGVLIHKLQSLKNSVQTPHTPRNQLITRMKLRGKGILVHLFRKVGIERIGLAAFVLSLRILQPFRKRNRKFRGLENYGRRSPIPTKKIPASVSFPSKYFKMQGWRNIRILFKLAFTKLLDTLRIRSSYTLH